MTRNRVALVIGALALVVAGVILGPLVYLAIAWKPHGVSQRSGLGMESSVGIGYRNRFTGARRHGQTWYVSNGFLATQGEPLGYTYWNPDGSILEQEAFDSDRRPANCLLYRDGPPWLWGVEPQTEATAPWLEDGISPEEWVRRELRE